MTVYVRRLRDTDLPSVLAISKWLHENSRYHVFSYNELKVRRLLSLSLSPGSNVFVTVALKQGSDDILGYFHGYVDPHYFSDMKYAGDWAVCVLPAYRRHAPAILKQMVLAFEKWARGMGAEEISIGASTESYGTGYKKFLQRMGYRDVGFLAVKG
jgi:GNAT superfamily N-acetyltransferase